MRNEIKAALLCIAILFAYLYFAGSNDETTTDKIKTETTTDTSDVNRRHKHYILFDSITVHRPTGKYLATITIKDNKLSPETMHRFMKQIYALKGGTEYGLFGWVNGKVHSSKYYKIPPSITNQPTGRKKLKLQQIY